MQRETKKQIFVDTHTVYLSKRSAMDIVCTDISNVIVQSYILSQI